VFSACYIGEISRFARNDMLLSRFTRPSNLMLETWNLEKEVLSFYVNFQVATNAKIQSIGISFTPLS